MDKSLKEKLIDIARKEISKNDPSHDIGHSLRVLEISEKIAREETADLDILIPAALFHDVINYPKNHKDRLNSSRESAEFAKRILKRIDYFSKEKIEKIYTSINLCSFTRGKTPEFLEAKILQDADGLESMGAISIMRTFSSAGVMNKIFYNPEDPFCKERTPDDNKYALDLFFTRLLVIQGRIHTKIARNMAKKRILFLKKFLKELQDELLENKVYEK